MSGRKLALTGMLLFPWLTFGATQSVYCPQNSGYINVGMSQAEVIKACGQPVSKQESNKPVYQQVPMTQLTFNNQGNNTPVFWALPPGLGVKNSYKATQFDGNIQSGGVKLQVNIINDKISSVSMNGNGSNAFSICGGRNIQVGDPASSVYQSCGAPSVVNQTYINQPIPSSTKPEIWVYQPGQYQSPINLTFIDGKLQSID